MIKKLLIILCLCAPAWATTTITGNLKTLSGGAISLGTFVRFYLRGCSGNQPRINGTAIIGPTLGNVYYTDFVPNSSGAISGTVYSTTDATGTGNGDIECGGVKTGLWYGMVAFLNGKSGPETPIAAKTGITIDISSISPLTANPVVVSPTGDQTYARLDGGNQPFTGSVSVPNLNQTCYADQQAGADMGAKIQACITALPNGGIIDATGFTPGSTQVWSGNLFGSAAKPLLIKLGQVSINVNAQQVPGSPSQRIQGAGGLGSGTGTCQTTLVKNFDGSALFAPGSSAVQFGVSSMCITVGVTQTSGWIFNPTAGAQDAYIRDIHFQNIYGGFNLIAAGGVVMTGWRIEDISFNCFPNTVHTGSFIRIGSTDNSVTSSEHSITNMLSSGHTCIMDAPMYDINSGTDSAQFYNINASPSRTNTSTQPIWIFHNTLASNIQPRLINQVGVQSEGDTQTGQDTLQISACNICTFTGGDYSGGDHGVNISGGSDIKFFGGNIINNQNGGLYVTSAVAKLGLRVVGVAFTGNSVTTNNTFDDIQIADGTTGVTIVGNTFSLYPSTVTSNLTRWPINFLGTTSTGIFESGNQEDAGKYTNAGLIRDYTAATGHFFDETGRTVTWKGASGSSRLWLQTGATHLNWQLDASEQCSTCFEIIPSTANGGLTFTNPALSVAANGVGGTLNIFGSTSGSIALNAPAVAGSGGANFPANTGTVAELNLAQTWTATQTLNNGPVAGGSVSVAGTGACATITTTAGGGWAGTFKCTGTTGASTVTITPGTTAPNGWTCYVQDETTRGNLFQQTSHNGTTCVLTATSITQNDVFVFSAIAF